MYMACSTTELIKGSRGHFGRKPTLHAKPRLPLFEDVIMKRIPLTQGLVALVDDTDFDWLNEIKWTGNRKKYTSYAVTKHTKMHRVILNAPDGLEVDHIDGNGLNNQRSNLRLCTHRENQRNRPKNKNNKSGYKGVFWNSRANKWRVGIRVDRKDIFLGTFFCLIKAAKAYDEAAIKYFGEFAYLNFN